MSGKPNQAAVAYVLCMSFSCLGAFSAPKQENGFVPGEQNHSPVWELNFALLLPNRRIVLLLKRKNILMNNRKQQTLIGWSVDPKQENHNFFSTCILLSNRIMVLLLNRKIFLMNVFSSAEKSRQKIIFSIKLKSFFTKITSINQGTYNLPPFMRVLFLYILIIVFKLDVHSKTYHFISYNLTGKQKLDWSQVK